MSVTFDFDGQVALVTGAAGALGSVVATEFADAGATVVGTDVRSPESGETELDPESIEFYEADFTDEDDVERVVSTVVEEHGGLDYLLNVAGTWKGGSQVSETSLETVRTVFAVNLETMFLASKHALPHLRTGDGAIVSVSSKSSLSGGTGDGPYRASKAGVRLLTETIAAENEGSVRANAVMPDVIDTPANRAAFPDASFEEWTDPIDIARTILVLSSDAMAVTNGAAVPVYGRF
ncbi:MAG: SDR family NAD(P)-dependent oxidoreductase [Halodesulfurarchaeum sp.]